MQLQNTSSQGTRTLNALTSPFFGFVINPKSKATSDKFKRLRKRGFLTKDGKINIMIVKSSWNDFKNMLPSPDKSLLDELYDSGTFRHLTEEEKVTANFLMFADKLLE